MFASAQAGMYQETEYEDEYYAPEVEYPPQFLPQRSKLPSYDDGRVLITYEMSPTVAPTEQIGKVILHFFLRGGDVAQNVQEQLYDDTGYPITEARSLYMGDSLFDEISTMGDELYIYSFRFGEEDDKVYAWESLLEYISKQPKEEQLVYSAISSKLNNLLQELDNRHVEKEKIVYIERPAAVRPPSAYKQASPPPPRAPVSIRHSGVQADHRARSRVIRTPVVEKKIVKESLASVPSSRVKPGREFIEEKEEYYSPRSTAPRSSASPAYSPSARNRNGRY